MRRWWRVHGDTVLGASLVLMAIVSALRLPRGFARLLWGGAVDLRFRHREVQLWFVGEPVYGTVPTAVYPPASYALLWPFLGWSPLSVSRWLWALTATAALAWLSWIAVRESGVALLPVAGYPAQIAIGVGQLIVPVLPMLVAGILGAHRGAGWRCELRIAGLLLAALVKPSLSAPFFWIALFLPKGLRPALAASGAYVGLTLLAASFQGDDLTSLLTAWLARGSAGAVGNPWSHTNAHEWLGLLGLGRWTLVASGILVAALGIWTYGHRQVDVWLLLGVTALAARFWTYHLLYDDLLVLLPMISLFRLAVSKTASGGRDVVAGALLALTSLAMVAPGRLLFVEPPWGVVAQASYALLWAIVLAFLLQQAHRARRSAVAPRRVEASGLAGSG